MLGNFVISAHHARWCHAVIQYFDAQAPSSASTQSPMRPPRRWPNFGMREHRPVEPASSPRSMVRPIFSMLLRCRRTYRHQLREGGARPRASLLLCTDKVKTEYRPGSRLQAKVWCHPLSVGLRSRLRAPYSSTRIVRNPFSTNHGGTLGYWHRQRTEDLRKGEHAGRGNLSVCCTRDAQDRATGKARGALAGHALCGNLKFGRISAALHSLSMRFWLVSSPSQFWLWWLPLGVRRTRCGWRSFPYAGLGTWEPRRPWIGRARPGLWLANADLT